MSLAAQAAPRWRVADATCFDSRQWDEEVVLYVLATGETHALAPAQSATLSLLQEHPDLPRTVPDWLALMSGDADSADRPPAQQLLLDEADLQALAQALQDLHSIGVVERLSA